MIEEEKFNILKREVEDDRYENITMVYVEDIWRESNGKIANTVNELLDYLQLNEYMIKYIKVEVDKGIEVSVVRLI